MRWMSKEARKRVVLALLANGCWLLASCRQDMHDQPKYAKPYQPSNFFRDGRSERPIIPGTVARGHLRTDRELYYGRVGNTDDPVDRFPFPVTRAVLERGRERYNIYCTPCHGFTGDGLGMIRQRGLSYVPTYHDDRLRAAPVGHFYDVITNGYGAMYSYAQRISVNDRWAIVAYIRALQYSQNASTADVPDDQRAQLSAAPGPRPGPGEAFNVIQPGAARPGVSPNQKNQPEAIMPGHVTNGGKR